MDVPIHVFVRQRGEHRTGDVGLQVDPDQIHQPEYASLRYTHRPADDRVGLFHGQFIFKGESNGALHPQDADAVCDESRCVVALDHTLAQGPVAKFPQYLDRILPGLLASDDLQQSHVPWRIKEMGNCEILGKSIG